jgi:large subunit ribosomal protein L25
MTDFIELQTTERDVIGKANRRLAAENMIPAVLYGHNVEPTTVSIDRHTFEYMMSHEAIASTILKVSVDDGDVVNVIVKEIQQHPVSGKVQHVDLLAISLKQRIHTTVPIRLTGEAPGSEEGGVLTQTLTEIEIEALPTELPDSVEADISELMIGDAVHVYDLSTPEGVDILSDPKSIVVSITVPHIEEEPEEEEEELLEVPEIGEEEEGEGEEAAADSSEEAAPEEE